MKKGWKIVLIPLAIIFFALTAIYLAIQTRPVQNFAARKLTNYLSEQFGTNIHIGGVDVALFRRVVLKDVWIEDQHADTLVYSQRVSATIDTLNFRKKNLSLSRISFDHTKAYFEKDSTGMLNYQFLALAKKTDLQTGQKWKLSCDRFILRNSHFTYNSFQQQIRHLQIDEVSLRLDNFRLDEDSLSFQIFSMSLNDGKGFYLNEFSADFAQVGKDIFLTNLRLETLNSEIDKADIAIRQQPMPGTGETVTDLEIDLFHSKLSLADISLFIPQLEGMEQKLELSGRVTGNMQNLRARNLNIKTGNNTQILADFSISNMPGFSEPFIFIDMKQSRSDFRDISRIRLPNSSKVDYLVFPQQLYQAGIISYQGNFTGFLSDFVAYGTLSSRMGLIRTDISIVPDAANMLQYRGRLETASFNIGRLMQSPQFGQISFNGMVNGTFDRKKETIEGEFDGKISRWLLNNYNYQDITLNGQLSNKKFDGNIVVDDPNLKLDFSGELNLNEKVPVFDFLLHLQEADLTALNLDSLNSVSKISFDMAANFSGNKMDNLDGLIQVFGAKYINQNDSLNLKNLIIGANLDEIQSRINIESDYANLSIVGTYDFSSLFESFRAVLARYLPAVGHPMITNELKNQFELDLSVNDLDGISSVFLPGLKVKTPFRVIGEINTQQGTLKLAGEIPEITWNDFTVKNIDINIKPNADELSSRFRIGQFNFKEEVTLHNLSLIVDAGKNEMNTRILWNNLDKITYGGDMETNIVFRREAGNVRPIIDIDVLPSKIIIADSIWNLSPTKVIIDSTSVFIDNFLFGTRNHFVTVNGKISEDRNDQLSIELQNMDLGKLDLYLQEDTGLKGVVNGSLGIFDFYRNRLFYSDIAVKGLEYQNQAIGDISITNKWDRETNLIDTEVMINQNNRNQFTGRGSFNPFSKKFIFDLKFNHFSIGILNVLINEGLTNFHGDGSGRVILSGTPDKIFLDGAIYAENGGLTVDYTQVSYRLNDSIRFSNDSLIFRRIEVRDIQNNRGIFNGSIRHDNFRNMDYNLVLTTNQIMAINTNSQNNDTFYGSAIARGSLRITGKGQNVRLAGEATSLAGTNITIVLGEDYEVTKYDFVRFLTRDTIRAQSQTVAQTNETGGTEIDLTVTVTPEARAQIIYNTQITDVIRAQGEGVLRFRMDRYNNINLSGNYNVTQGEYLFTLQNVINKRFAIEPGGSIVWSGDPYNATIDISAVYRLKASLRELLMGSMRTIDYNLRIPVECKILLTNELISPTINFDIVFPTAEDRIRDEVQQYFATQEDLNKQMLSLLVLGQFYTPEFIRGTYEARNPNLIGNTASDLFSNQLSNWLSQINRDIDIGINYRPGNQLTNDEIELALSTQIFNDRVIINGNVGNNTNPNRINNNELVGDFDIIVKLTPNGKLQLKVYNRANNNLIYETAPYTQGIGISYKEEYNTIDELWLKFIAIFRREKTSMSTELAGANKI